MRLPDRGKSRIVLFGTSVHRSYDLPNVPVVENNIRDLAAALTDTRYGIVGRRDCHTILNMKSQRQFGRRLLAAARSAEDLLLVYYAGHGLLGPRRHELFLTLPDTEPDALAFTALPFEAVRDACLESPAACRVVILDCCYSGRAIGETLAADEGAVLGQIQIGGTYTLTSSPANRTSIILPGEVHTAFTGRLIRLLNEGMPDGPTLLGLGEIYRYLRTQLAAEGLPLPQQRGTETGDLLALTRNRGVEIPQTAIEHDIVADEDKSAARVQGDHHLNMRPASSRRGAGGRGRSASTDRKGERPESPSNEGLSIDENEAATLFRAVIADRARILGMSHPDTLTSRHDFAVHLGDRGTWGEAVELLRGVIVDRVRVQGPDHPHTLGSRHALAVYLGLSGDHVESIRLFRKVISDRVRVLGKEHPDTLASCNQLAFRVGQSGDRAEAIRLFREVATDRERVLGPDHADTLTSRHHLAYQVGEGGDPAEAIKLFRQVISNRTRVLGRDHPDTLTSRLNAAGVVNRVGNRAEAIRLTGDVVLDRIRILGPDHPDTLAGRHYFAYLVGENGNRAEAARLFQQVVSDRIRVLGQDHPNTLASRAHFAYQIGQAGDRSEAARLFQQVVSDRIRVLGQDHPDTLAACHSLAYQIGEGGNHAEATRLFRQVLSDRERILGPDHPDTLSSRQSLAIQIGRMQ